jgi:hypothetical protein
MNTPSTTLNTQEMNDLPNFQNPAFDSIYVDFQEVKRFVAEQIAETERLRRESDAKFEKYREDYEKRQKKIDELLGSWDNNHGAFAEEYFFNSFEKGEQNFFGEKFDEIEKNLKPRRKNNISDEYDIVMTNGSSVALIETKFKAHEKDIEKVKQKAQTYKVLCPEHKDYKIYLGLASMSFYSELEQQCMEQGIAVIKQVGDKVVINDAHLKVF